METAMELIVGLILTVAVCWFIFDIDIKKVFSGVIVILLLIVAGIIMGIGAHITDLIFKW